MSWPHAEPTPTSAIQADFRELQARMNVPSLRESIRLLTSEKFHLLNDDHLYDVANYRSIDLDDEVFFERAFTPGKEAAASLGFARHLGRETVLEDLVRLRASLDAA